MLGILDYGLAKVADLMIKYVVSAAVNYRSPASFVEDLVQDSEVITGAVIKIVPSHDLPSHDPRVYWIMRSCCKARVLIY